MMKNENLSCLLCSIFNAVYHINNTTKNMSNVLDQLQWSSFNVLRSLRGQHVHCCEYMCLFC